jgi:chromosome partitioning protein
MKMIAFVARKGGVSKTTLTAHIAVTASASHPVILVDADPQHSLTDWWNDREADTPALMDVTVGRLSAELAKVEGEDGLVMVDTPAFDSGIVATVIHDADLVVIPVKPSPHDLRSIGVTVEAVQKAGKPYVFVITQAIGGASLTTQARAVLAESGPVVDTVMHNRVAYAGAMTDGRTVLETDPHGKAAVEVAAIYHDIMKSFRKAVKSKGSVNHA